ncbi:MAG: hypothetical protein WCY98_11980 [Castellaniella sp.]
MRSRLLQFFLGGSLSLMAPAMAQAIVLPEAIQAEQAAWYEIFFGESGLEHVESTMALFSDEWYDSEHVPPATGGISMPDADMSPLEMAVALVDHHEGALPHARYRIGYRAQFAIVEDYTAPPLAYVEVMRFNLGPARHASVVADYGAENAAPVEEFGVGPHVVWRFLMGSVQGRLSDVFDAARGIIDDAQVQAMDCLGVPCMSLEDVEDSSDGWHTLVMDDDNTDARPAQVADLMAMRAMGSEYGEIVEGLDPVKPQLSLVISRNVTGQDDFTSALSHQGPLMDDAVSDQWLRRLQLSGHVEWSRRFIYRPGRQ